MIEPKAERDAIRPPAGNRRDWVKRFQIAGVAAAFAAVLIAGCEEKKSKRRQSSGRYAPSR